MSTRPAHLFAIVWSGNVVGDEETTQILWWSSRIGTKGAIPRRQIYPYSLQSRSTLVPIFLTLQVRCGHDYNKTHLLLWHLYPRLLKHLRCLDPRDKIKALSKLSAFSTRQSILVAPKSYYSQSLSCTSYGPVNCGEFSRCFNCHGQ